MATQDVARTSALRRIFNKKTAHVKRPFKVYKTYKVGIVEVAGVKIGLGMQSRVGGTLAIFQSKAGGKLVLLCEIEQVGNELSWHLCGVVVAAEPSEVSAISHAMSDIIGEVEHEMSSFLNEVGGIRKI